MIEISKTYSEKVPAMRFIGKQYSDADRVDGTFSYHWCKWNEENLFSIIREAAGGIHSQQQLCTDGESAIGLMRSKEGEQFEYWIGMFTPAHTVAPEEFDYVDFEASVVGTGWIHDREENLYCHECEVAHKLNESGHEVITDSKGATWFFERYVDPRFSAPDKDEKVILDICFFVKE